MPLGYSESEYKKPICKVRVQCTRNLASKYKLDNEPVSQLHLEHYSLCRAWKLCQLVKSFSAEKSTCAPRPPCPVPVPMDAGLAQLVKTLVTRQNEALNQNRVALQVLKQLNA